MPPRLLRPKNDLISSEESDLTVGGEGRSGKRKTVSSACIPCRKRKSKCDGQLPACSTCIAVYRTDCSYDADTDGRRKGSIKREAQPTIQSNDALEVIIASLRSLPEGDAIDLLRKLRADGGPDSVVNALRAPDRPPLHSYESQYSELQSQTTATSALSTPFEQAAFPGSLSRNQSVDDGRPFRLNPSPTMTLPSDGVPMHKWLLRPQDPELVEHLLSLYFCWIHPLHPFVSQRHFMNDMERGGTDFCSPLLVNSMLAFACHYSDRPEARTDPNDPATAGDHFYADVQQIMLNAPDEASDLTAVQALGILSLRETSAGRESSGYRYAGRSVRMALELALHLSVMKNGMRPPEHEMRKNTFWAVFNLETLCALAFGRVSQLPRSATDIELPVADTRADLEKWRPHEDNNSTASSSVPEQPALGSIFHQALTRLFELASDMVNTFYAPREQFTSRRLAATYQQYQEWFGGLPDDLSLKRTSLPHVLVMHMLYYGCVLHLFRPYIKLDLSGANLYPRDACTVCANEISTLTNALRGMYGLRRVCVPVTTLLLSAATIHLLNLPSEPAATNLTQALHDLQAISVNHRFAGRAIGYIRSLSNKWRVTLPEPAAHVASWNALGHQGTPSIQSSAFFAATIPRNTSGESSSTDDSPFPPPSSSNPRLQRPSQPPTSAMRSHSQGSLSPVFFSSDPATTFDTAQSLMAFWTPFPGQGMPLFNNETHTPFRGTTFNPMEQQQQHQGLRAMPGAQQQQWNATFTQQGNGSENWWDAGTNIC